MSDTIIPSLDHHSKNLPVVTFAAWLLMIVAALDLFVLLVDFKSRNTGEELHAQLSQADDWFTVLVCAFGAVVMIIFGYGLRKRVWWAWEGTVNLALMFAFLSTLIPSIHNT